MSRYPGWWAVGAATYPDVEKQVLRPLFQPHLSDISVVSWLPKPDVYNTQLQAGKGYLRTFRVGGAVNFEQNRDEPRVQFAALTGSRDESWELIGFVREVLGAYWRHAAVVPGTPYKLSTVGEIVGPQLIPELLQDDRLVPVTFEFHTWKPKGLPNYRQALGL